ncbi:MAG TPA: nucleotidyl transferase AbiEii/AbiGii toxin family protein [Acidobacteriaceae bacterium]|nr:nucleotidyl transferase AbiEii/AbiGii toxin family protein [Acidobacteriaceae bacterium]
MSQGDTPLPVTSSTEPAWALEAEECYRDVIQALQQAQVAYAVGGGFALHKHTGIWRTTKDLDLLLEPRHVPRALAQLRKAGFETLVKDPVWLAKAIRGNYFVDLITGVGNAAIVVEASWIERSPTDQILGLPCRVLAAEEMIASKLFVTRRERFDGADVAHLIRACGDRLDWQRVLDILGCHWELLYWALIFYAYIYPANIALVPERIWVELSTRFQQHVMHPPNDAPSRGSLVDPFMFAIDVNEWGERNLYREYCERHPCLLDEAAAKGDNSGSPNTGSKE